MQSPSSLSFPTTGCLKTPACKRAMLSPLSECYSDGWGHLSGLLSLIKTCCLQRLQILSQSLSLFIFKILLNCCCKVNVVFKVNQKKWAFQR
jgi:hypothetical protein